MTVDSGLLFWATLYSGELGAKQTAIIKIRKSEKKTLRQSH